MSIFAMENVAELQKLFCRIQIFSIFQSFLLLFLSVFKKKLYLCTAKTVEYSTNVAVEDT